MFVCLGWLGGATALQSSPLTLTPYQSLEPRLSAIVDFESFPNIITPGTELPGVQQFDGIAFAERFAGQRLEDEGGFDRLDGPPLMPLTLLPGAEGENLSVSNIMIFGRMMAGLGPAKYPNPDAGGEGAVSFLFDHDQFAFGLKVAAEIGAGNAGTMEVTAYTRDAREIGRLTVPLDPGWHGYGFVREGEVRDIAGVTLTNADPAGISIDDVIYDQVEVIGLAPQKSSVNVRLSTTETLDWFLSPREVTGLLSASPVSSR